MNKQSFLDWFNGKLQSLQYFLAILDNAVFFAHPQKSQNHKLSRPTVMQSMQQDSKAIFGMPCIFFRMVWTRQTFLSCCIKMHNNPPVHSEVSWDMGASCQPYFWNVHPSFLRFSDTWALKILRPSNLQQKAQGQHRAALKLAWVITGCPPNYVPRIAGGFVLQVHSIFHLYFLRYAQQAANMPSITA